MEKSLIRILTERKALALQTIAIRRELMETSLAFSENELEVLNDDELNRLVQDLREITYTPPTR